VDELDRPDVHPPRRLADQQQVRVALDLARDNDLLLVAAREVRGLQRGIGGRTSKRSILARVSARIASLSISQPLR
jgi:phosphoenolpyruvate-protein kinase (PTS system EI component)